MTDSDAPPRVVIVAEHASALFGGEAILPLHYFRFLRRRGVEAWLVVHERTREELTGILLDEIDRVHFVSDTWLHRVLWRITRILPGKTGPLTAGLLMHGLTQARQRRIAHRLVHEHGANVIHEPIPVSPKQPSFMFGVGAPVIIGPMNGGMHYPEGFEHYEGRFERLVMRLGRMAATAVNMVVPGKRRAARLLVANERTRRALPGGMPDRMVEMVENGVDLETFPITERRPPDRARPRFVFLGRLVDWKAVDHLLQAFRLASAEVDMELEIIGEGPERPALEALCDRLDLRERVVFTGWVAQSACPELLRACDALVLPSLRECGGAVALEAMALGLPVIVPAWGGPADYATPECGVLVDPRGGPERFRSRLRDALITLASDPELRLDMGRRGQRRILEEFDWERKIDRILDVYREVAT